MAWCTARTPKRDRAARLTEAVSEHSTLFMCQHIQAAVTAVQRHHHEQQTVVTLVKAFARELDTVHSRTTRSEL